MSTAEKDPAMAGNDEPSMEEILASIRKIIDSDEEAAADGGDALADGTVEEPAQSAGEEATAQPDDASEATAEVLELTKAVEDDGSVRDLKTGEITAETVAVEVSPEDTPSEAAAKIVETPEDNQQDDPLANIDAFADMVDEDNSDAIAALTAEPEGIKTSAADTEEDDPFAAASEEETYEESSDTEDDPFAVSPEEDSLDTEPVEEQAADTPEESGDDTSEENFDIDFGDDTDNDVADSVEDTVIENTQEEIQQETVEETAEEIPNAALLSKETASAAAEAMASLKASLQASTKISSNPGNTLEDLAASLMKPMLKEWLDENLPPLVERVVKAEIEKLKLDL